MPGPNYRVREAVWDTLERVDAKLLPRMVRSASVSTEETRTRLRLRGWAFLDPLAEPPEPAAVEATAARLIREARMGAAALGGVAGLGGLLSVPPEVVGQAVSALRLAQRLAVVYGVDPETSRGRMVLWKALSAGFEIEAPAEGTLSARLTDVPRSLRSLRSVGDVRGSAGVELARSVLRSSAGMVASRAARFVPGLSSGMAAVSARRRTTTIGRRMQAVYRREAGLPEPTEAVLVDAVEVPGR